MFVKRAHLFFPGEWQHLQTRKAGPFVTSIVHRLKDGSLHIWSSRQHRKGFGAEIVPPGKEKPLQKRHYSLWVWAPGKINWWIAVLFMIGAFLFAAGSVLTLAEYTNEFRINLIYFIGSLFFTSAAYVQYFQAINAKTNIDDSSPSAKRKWFAWQSHRIDFWVTGTQFIGTILFNYNTFDAFLKLDRFGKNLLVWLPDIEGSIFFMISGALAMFEICHRWCWKIRDIEWWLTFINFLGCIAFLLSAVMAYAAPHPLYDNLPTLSTFFTLLGAICFFQGAYLLWPEISAKSAPAPTTDPVSGND